MITPVLAGCGRYPEDPANSLEQILERKVLRVGALLAEPWVIRTEDDRLGGAEGRLIDRFAKELGVKVQTYWTGEEDTFQLLANHEIDVVVGGLTTSNPWAARAGFTAPYYTSQFVVGVPTRSPPLPSVSGLTVGVRPNSPLRQQLQEKNAEVVEVSELGAASLPVAGPEWELEYHGFSPTRIRLASDKHVMAVPRGENALLMRLERFLADVEHEQVEAFLQEASKP